MTSIWVKNINIRHLLDLFLASAVGSVLLIRVFLAVTGYPSIGGASLHIAHVLWGGFFMLTANVILLTFLGNRVKDFAAVMGGIGFGLFIDEVGKFVTRDNNYFFQPSVMIIYLVFVVIYFAFRYLEENSQISEPDKVVNALAIAQEFYLNDLDTLEQRKLKQLLGEISKDNLWHNVLGQIANHQAPKVDKNLLYRSQQFINSQFIWLINRQWFIQVLILLFVVQAILITISLTAFQYQLTVLAFGLVSSVLAGGYFLWGLFNFRKNSSKAYEYFYRANLVLVLITQPFIFYFATFVPLVALIINILSLFSLRYILDKQLHLVSNGG